MLLKQKQGKPKFDFQVITMAKCERLGSENLRNWDRNEVVLIGREGGKREREGRAERRRDREGGELGTQTDRT